ncbi:MAG: U6 snRNA-associated Sm-like protein LSm6 [Nitrososphaeria archaeon]
MSIQPKKPLNILQKMLDREVVVRLKSNIEYHGKMVNVDMYMNMILDGTKEFNEGQQVASYGTVIIRGNNVLFVGFKNSSGI